MSDDAFETSAMTKAEHEHFAEHMDRYSPKYGRAYRLALLDALSEMPSEPSAETEFPIKIEDKQIATGIETILTEWIKNGKKRPHRFYTHEDQMPPQR